MSFPPLSINLLDYQSHLRFRMAGTQRLVWDVIRRKYVVLTPEELVRQLLVHYLILTGKVSKHRLSVEREIVVFGKKRRYDLLIHGPEGQAIALVECKRPEIDMNQPLLNQSGAYNQALQVDWLILSNGPQTWCLHLNRLTGQFEAHLEMPDFFAK